MSGSLLPSADASRPHASARLFVALCVGLTLASLCYVLCDAYKWPRLTYFPYENQWAWRRQAPNAAPMLYVGMMLWATLGFIAGLAATWVWFSARRGAPSPAAQRLWGAWALTSVALAGSYFWWNLWPLPT
ncbi:MAG: hypothetical protein IPL79_05540 [Myxococcales bacterium]|nr:hypothetical protein [Myxococcales bacterium]